MVPERSNVISGNQLKNATSIVTSTSQLPSHASNIPNQTPPPLPPRQGMQNYSGYNNYRPFASSYYNSYGYGNNCYRNYGNYSPLGSYTPYSSALPYNNYGHIGGHSGDNESRFFQYAEESTRSTLQVVESALQTFSSVTMMLESTYFAMTNSIRAILSVAENITRLRSTFGQLLSTLTLFRLIRWICKKIMYMIGLKNDEIIHEEVWKNSVPETINGVKLAPSSWPGFLLLCAFMAIPYLIHKISSNAKKIQTKGMDPNEWFAYNEPVYTATVLYDFVATSKEELNLSTGQKIWLAPHSLQPKIPGWWRATDGRNVGLIPFNYVKVISQLMKKTDIKHSEISTHDPMDKATNGFDDNRQINECNKKDQDDRETNS